MTDAVPAPLADEIQAILAPFATVEGALLPMLHALQAAFGHIPQAAHAPLIKSLQITKAELQGVLSFYHDFRAAPAGRQTLKICRAEACQAMGGAEMAKTLLARLGLDWHGTSPDGGLTVEPVYCLGLCACGPAAMIGERPLGRITVEGVMAQLGEARA